MGDERHDDDDLGEASGPAPLAPRRARGRYSVVRLPGHWFVLAESHEIGRDAPLARTLMGTPLALFRDADGAPRALLDRCPHRNVPLSIGRVARDGTLECGYHGWRFDGDGACRAIPGLVGEPGNKARACAAFPVVEQQGFVWVFSTPGPMPTSRPHRFAYADDPAYVTVRQQLELPGTLHAALENALDVPHTAFLHRGLFRSESRGIPLEVRVSRTADRAEAEYVGEPRPPGLMARLLSPSGGLVTHFDRFLMPSIAQVEYRIGEENHVLADTAMTPVSDFVTRVYGVVSLRSRLPARAIEPFVKPLGLRVLAQDAAMLARQTEAVRAFGGEQFAWTEIDVLGKHIWRLLRAAERGESVGPDVRETRALVV